MTGTGWALSFWKHPRAAGGEPPGAGKGSWWASAPMRMRHDDSLCEEAWPWLEWRAAGASRWVRWDEK